MNIFARRPDEKYADYAQRRAALKSAFKDREQPRVLWDSSRAGTYISKEHGSALMRRSKVSRNQTVSKD